MAYPLRTLDQGLNRLSPAMILVVAGCGVLIVEGIDYVTGYEVSLSLLYLGPIALASWYGGRWPGVAIATLSCLGWYLADLAAGSEYSNAAIPVWNAFVRLGFFLITARLLIALHDSLLAQRHLARFDSLTGLFRRRAFEERFAHDLALAQRRRSPLTLAYLDVDDFKRVNDEHGHAAGDAVLRSVGEVLRRFVREADTAARLGGDEFVLLLPDTDDRGAGSAISSLVAEIERTLREDGWNVTCSVGVVSFLDPDTSLEEATAAADELMYRVKRAGKGAVKHRVLGRPA